MLLYFSALGVDRDLGYLQGPPAGTHQWPQVVVAVVVVVVVVLIAVVIVVVVVVLVVAAIVN